jgi:hypothetical protein
MFPGSAELLPSYRVNTHAFSAFLQDERDGRAAGYTVSESLGAR